MGIASPPNPRPVKNVCLLRYTQPSSPAAHLGSVGSLCPTVLVVDGTTTLQEPCYHPNGETALTSPGSNEGKDPEGPSLRLDAMPG